MTDRKNKSLIPEELSNLNLDPEISNVILVKDESVEEVEVSSDSVQEEDKIEKKEKWKLWLSENYKGSRRIRLANGMRFNLNRLDEEDQEAAKKKDDYPIKEVEMTDTQIQNLRTQYGFKAQRLGG